MPSWLHLIWGKPSGMVYFYSMKTNKSNVFLHPIVVHRQLNRIRISNVCLSQLLWALGWWRNRGPTRQRRKRLIFCVTSWHHECFSWFLRILPKNKDKPICLNFKIYSFCQKLQSFFVIAIWFRPDMAAVYILGSSTKGRILPLICETRHLLSCIW